MSTVNRRSGGNLRRRGGDLVNVRRSGRNLRRRGGDLENVHREASKLWEFTSKRLGLLNFHREASMWWGFTKCPPWTVEVTQTAPHRKRTWCVCSFSIIKRHFTLFLTCYWVEASGLEKGIICWLQNYVTDRRQMVTVVYKICQFSLEFPKDYSWILHLYQRPPRCCTQSSLC